MLLTRTTPLFLGLLLLGNPALAQPDKGLVLHLPLTHDLVDLVSGKKVDGRSVEVESGKQEINLSGCAIFNDYPDILRVQDRNELDTDDEFSLMLWIRPKQYLDRQGRRAFLISKWYSSPHHGDYILGFAPGGEKNKRGELALSIARRENGRQKQQSILGTSEIPLNEWSHVGATFNRGQFRLYLNGHLESELISKDMTHSERGEYTHDGICIGSLPWAVHDAYGFLGKMADVRIYQRALSEQEVADLFWQAIPETAPDLAVGNESLRQRLGALSAIKRFRAVYDFLKLSEPERNRLAGALQSKHAEPDVELLLKNLGHASFRVREQATRKLQETGRYHRERLLTMLRETRDPEIRHRLRHIANDLPQSRRTRSPDRAFESIRRALKIEKATP